MQELGCQMKNPTADRNFFWENTHQLDARCVKYRCEMNAAYAFFIERDRVTKTPQMKGETNQNPRMHAHTLLEHGFFEKLQKNKIDSKH